MSIQSRIERLEAQTTNARGLIAAIGGGLVTVLPSGLWQLPDGREVSEAEFETLCQQHRDTGRVEHILIMDDETT